MPALAGQKPPDVEKSSNQKRALTNQQRLESVELQKQVSRVAAGELPGGDVWIAWEPHFFRGSGGKTYIPFTLRVEEAPEDLDAIGMYVRAAVPIASQEGGNTARMDDLSGANAGDVPINVPERQFVRRGTPTAGENSAMLAATEAYLRQSRTQFPFEDLHFGALQKPASGDARVIRRALTLPAGEYDIFIAVRETGKKLTAPAKGAVLKKTIVVPDFSSADLQMSSVLRLDSLEPLGKPLSAREQVERPYAFGSAEFLPARDANVPRESTLTLAFFLYNPALDASRAPNVRVEYEFYRVGLMYTFFNATQPQVFDSPLPTGSDRTMVVDAAVPMASFQPGAYRLQIKVTDERGGATLAREFPFTVVDSVTRR
jgi:hypothetical protein